MVTVTELLPAALSLVSMAGTGWSCAGPAQPVCTRTDALSGGSSYAPIIVTVNVSASATQLSNRASVIGGGSNAAGAEDFTIVAPPAAGGSSSHAGQALAQGR